MPECNRCESLDNCTPYEEYDVECENFIDIYFNCLSNGSDGWEEFSYNRYTENILDYGEESEWDKFIREDYWK